MPKRKRPPTGKPAYPHDQPIWPPPEKHPLKPPVSWPRAAPIDLQIMFGESLKAARMRMGISQYELSRETGLTQQYLSLVETGRKNLTLRTMMALARAVGKTVSDMLRPRRT
jgi:DNA-binding XRE family transcriptional regulator